MRTLFMLLMVYAGSYAYLSAHGSYQTAAVATSSGVPAPARTWQPKGCDLSLQRADTKDRYNVDGNRLGLVFMPAIVLDRRIVHKDRSLI